MVNIGKRSKCCLACRKRRVKCDLQRPYCRRCTQGGRLCPGYPDAWGSMLRMQNNYAEERVQTRVTKAMAERMKEPRNSITSIPKGVHIAPELQSWNHFYREYIVGSGVVMFNILPQFYINTSLPCFQEALQAVTLANSAQQFRQPFLMGRARSHYGKAIATLNVALGEPSLCAEDSVLLTLFLFALFEIIVPEYLTSRIDVNIQCHIHLRGTLSLLQWRTKRGLDSQLDRRIFAFTYHICLITMFVNHDGCENKLLALEEFALPWVNTPFLEPIIAQAVRFKRQAQVELGPVDRSPPGTEFLQLMADGISIAQDLEAIATNVKFPAYRESSSHQHSNAFNGMFEVSNKTTEAIVRCLYRSLSYHVVELVLGLSARVDEECHGPSRIATSQFDPSFRVKILDNICQDICAILMLNNKFGVERDEPDMAYRAFGTFWSMAILLYSSLAGEVKRAWFQDKLRSIGEITGFGLATWAAEGTSKIHSSYSYILRDQDKSPE